jgi:hypothetical protein
VKDHKGYIIDQFQEKTKVATITCVEDVEDYDKT